MLVAPPLLPPALPGAADVRGSSPGDRWPDEAAFLAADWRRRASAEVDLGATWRAAGDPDAWRLVWLEGTGELYVGRLAGWPASSTDVRVLAVVRDEGELDRLLAGWRDARVGDDGLGWLITRLGQGVPAA